MDDLVKVVEEIVKEVLVEYKDKPWTGLSVAQKEQISSLVCFTDDFFEEIKANSVKITSAEEIDEIMEAIVELAENAKENVKDYAKEKVKGHLA